MWAWVHLLLLLQEAVLLLGVVELLLEAPALVVVLLPLLLLQPLRLSPLGTPVLKPHLCKICHRLFYKLGNPLLLPMSGPNLKVVVYNSSIKLVNFVHIAVHMYFF